MPKLEPNENNDYACIEFNVCICFAEFFTIHAQTAELSVLFSEPTFDSNQEATVHDKNIRLKGKVTATAGFKFAMLLSQGDKKSELHPSGDGMFQIDLELKEGVNEFMLGLADLSNNKEFLAFKSLCTPKGKGNRHTSHITQGCDAQGRFLPWL